MLSNYLYVVKFIREIFFFILFCIFYNEYEYFIDFKEQRNRKINTKDKQPNRTSGKGHRQIKNHNVLQACETMLNLTSN